MLSIKSSKLTTAILSGSESSQNGKDNNSEERLHFERGDFDDYSRSSEKNVMISARKSVTFI